MGRHILRALAVVLLAVVLPAIAAATAAHLMLDDSEWTDPKAAPPTRPAPAPTAAPVPDRGESPGPNGLVGRCAALTRTGAVLTQCVPGSLKVVGTVRRDAAKSKPCGTTPFTDIVRPYGAYHLCLGTP